MTDDNVVTSSSPTAQQLYRSLLTALRPIGPFNEERKKTSVHLARGSAFAGVQFRKEYLIVTIKSEQAIPSSRVVKAEQVSRNRWHNEVRIARDKDLDRELLSWIKAAYDLSE